MTILEERLIEEIFGILCNLPEERAHCVKSIKDRFRQFGDENFEELNENIQHDFDCILDLLPSKRKKCMTRVAKTFSSVLFLRVFKKLTRCPNTGGYHGYLTKGEIQLLYNMKIVKYPKVPIKGTDWFYFIPHKLLDYYIGQ